MRLIQCRIGVSRVIVILLLLLSFIFGALFSYVYTLGFYAPKEFELPGKSTITIQDVEFSPQDTSYFNVTVLNPSYSPSSVGITRIEARTTDNNQIHEINQTEPSIPFTLARGESRTFRASWNWANYTGVRLPLTDRPVEIRVFIQDENGLITGAIFETRKPRVVLLIQTVEFNSSISVTQFNMSVKNFQTSDTYVNVTSVSVTIANNTITPSEVIPSLPYGLAPGDPPANLTVVWNWRDYQGAIITLGAHTEQGYFHQETVHLPPLMNITISDLAFNATDTNHFNITATNSATSPGYVDISRITVSTGGLPAINISEWIAYPSSRLEKNSSLVLVCTWDWSANRGQTVVVTVYTSQGFTVAKESQIP